MGDLRDKMLFSIIATLLTTVEAHTLELNMFLAKYKVDIQDYIMSGYGKGWMQCDIFSANHMESQLYEDIPHVSIDIKNLELIDIGATLSSSHCLLSTYEVDSMQNLATLMEFGWRAIQHKRLALVIKMGPEMSLKKAIGFDKLPFLVVAQLENGKEQFLCPVIGEIEPQEHMCDKSHLSLNDKVLHVGIVGVGPYFVGGKSLAIIILNIFLLSLPISNYSDKKWN